MKKQRFQVWAGLTTSVSVVRGDETNIFPGVNNTDRNTLGNNNGASDVSSVQFNCAIAAGFPDGLKISDVFAMNGAIWST